MALSRRKEAGCGHCGVLASKRASWQLRGNFTRRGYVTVLKLISAP